MQIIWKYGLAAGKNGQDFDAEAGKNKGHSAISGQLSADNANLKAAITASQKQAKMSEK
ncbi:MAG: hypothetical protein AB1487_10740 [Thermodesulfobacteriota bacterium]